jgi:hypothetical protein
VQWNSIPTQKTWNFWQHCFEYLKPCMSRKPSVRVQSIYLSLNYAPRWRLIDVRIKRTLATGNRLICNGQSEVLWIFEWQNQELVFKNVYSFEKNWVLIAQEWGTDGCKRNNKTYICYSARNTDLCSICTESPTRGLCCVRSVMDNSFLFSRGHAYLFRNKICMFVTQS